MLNAITRNDKLARQCKFNGRTYYAAMLVFYSHGMYDRAFQMQESVLKERAYLELQNNPTRVYADEIDLAIISMLP